MWLQEKVISDYVILLTHELDFKEIRISLKVVDAPDRQTEKWKETLGQEGFLCVSEEMKQEMKVDEEVGVCACVLVLPGSRWIWGT